MKSWMKNEKSDFFSEKNKKSKSEWTPERSLKLAGGLVLVGAGTAVALSLLDDIV